MATRLRLALSGLLVATSPQPPANANVFISEFGEGTQARWLELYNAGNEAANLQDYAPAKTSNGARAIALLDQWHKEPTAQEELPLSTAVAAAPQNEGCDVNAGAEVVARQAEEIAGLQAELRSVRGHAEAAGRRLLFNECDWWFVFQNADVEEFEHKGCRALRGLHIGSEGDALETGITSLAGLSSLETTDFLVVRRTDGLQSLTGLENLRRVGLLFIVDNRGLRSLEGLQGLVEVDLGVYLERNHQLRSLDGLQGLEAPKNIFIQSNSGLQSLTALANLSRLEGELSISHSPQLRSLDGLQSLVELDRLFLRQNHQLRSLDGLQGLEVAREVVVAHNDELQSLTGLANLREGTVHIEGNTRLRSLDGLHGLEAVVGIIISNNSGLQSLTALRNLKRLETELRILDNLQLSSLDGLQGLVEVPRLVLQRNHQLRSLDGLQGLTHVGDWLRITRNDLLESLSGLENLTHSHYIILEDHLELRSVAALGKLAWINGLRISGCPRLHSLAGLGNLQGMLVRVWESPLNFLGAPFAPGSHIWEFDIDEASWPRCLTQHELTSLLLAVVDTHAILGARWQRDCGTDFGTFSCTKGQACSFSLGEEEKDYTSVFVSAHNVGCGVCSVDRPQGDVREGDVLRRTFDGV